MRHSFWPLVATLALRMLPGGTRLSVRKHWLSGWATVDVSARRRSMSRGLGAGVVGPEGLEPPTKAL